MIVIPHLILQKDNKILLTRRAPTQKIWPRYWHCVTGSIEAGETPREAIIREAWEEIGIRLSQLKLVTTVSLKEKDIFNPQDIFESLELFFLAYLDESQSPINSEPLKQDSSGWFCFDKLPVPVIPGVKFGLECYFSNFNYGEFQNV